MLAGWFVVFHTEVTESRSVNSGHIDHAVLSYCSNLNAGRIEARLSVADVFPTMFNTTLGIVFAQLLNAWTSEVINLNLQLIEIVSRCRDLQLKNKLKLFNLSPNVYECRRFQTLFLKNWLCEVIRT